MVVLHCCTIVHGGFVCAEARLMVVVRRASSGATDFHTQLSFVCFLPPGFLSLERMDLYSAPLFHG